MNPASAVALLLVLGACAPGVATVSSTVTEPPSAPTTHTAAPTTTAVTPTITTTTPPTTTTQPQMPTRERLVIHGVGDVALCNCFHDAFRRQGHAIAFSGMDGLFRRDALTIANLECTAADGGSLLSDKPDSFRCDVAALPVMADAGIDVAVMANNHSGDFGFEALQEARANLAAAGLNPVGAGADLGEATQAAFFERGGWTIAVVAFSGVSGLTYTTAYPPGPALVNPWFAEPDHPGVSPARFEVMTEVVSALDAMVDIVIVSLHQGEYNETWRPTALEVARGHALVDAGADAVIAHHHHRLLPMEVYRDRPIFWGMGNFVWARSRADWNATAVAEIVIGSDGSIDGRLIPAFIASHGHPVLSGRPDPTMWIEPPPFD
jgi:poly-gamma-glutamate synthesis protein (capsule biosynthesis protein)